MHARKSLRADFFALGCGPGRPLLVHSALRAVGPVEGGAETLIQALLDTLGPGGDLLFPNLHIPHAFDTANPPRFDLQRDLVRKTLGALPHVFKTSFAQAFSRHPTHSMMGTGPGCADLFAGHDSAGLPCGPGTPWWRLADARGHILLLGATQRCNTSIHGPEEVFADYQLGAETVEGVVIDEGRERIVRSRLHRWGNESDFSRINPFLAAAGGLRCGPVGDADCMLIDAAVLRRELIARLKHDQRFLLR